MTEVKDRLVRMKADTFRARLRLGMGMPSAVHVPEDLRLRDDAITSLCDALCVDGDLNLEGCTSLAALPPRLVVRGRLVIDGCVAIRELPSTVREVFGFSAQDCHMLKSIGSIVHCRGRLNLSGCQALGPLRPDFKAVGSAKLGQCSFVEGAVRLGMALPDAVQAAAIGMRVGEVVSHSALTGHPVLDARITDVRALREWSSTTVLDADTSALIIPEERKS